MPTSTAISAQGSHVYIEGTSTTSLSITAIAKGTTTTVTASNSLAGGEVVVFGAVAGMPEINGLIGIVAASPTSTEFTVQIDSSGFASDGTTGTATVKAFTEINNIADFSGFDGSTSELDKTNMQSGAMEYQAGLQDFGQFSMNIHIDNSDAGQLALRAAKALAATKTFKLALPNGKVRAFNGFVKKIGESGGVNALHKGSVDIRITGVVAFG